MWQVLHFVGKALATAPGTSLSRTGKSWIQAFRPRIRVDSSSITRTHLKRKSESMNGSRPWYRLLFLHGVVVDPGISPQLCVALSLDRL